MYEACNLQVDSYGVGFVVLASYGFLLSLQLIAPLLSNYGDLLAI